MSFSDLGTCVISVTQAGSAEFLPVSTAKQTVVIGAMLTSVGLTTTVPPATFGQAARVMARVGLTTGVVSGRVQFTLDGRNFAVSQKSQKLVNAVATGALLVDARRRH